MTVRAALQRGLFPPTFPPQLIGFAACVGLAGLAALSLLYMDFWALAVPAYLGVCLLAAAAPEKAALLLLGAGIAIEPAAIDFTRPLSLAVWQMPPGLEQPFGFTTSPMELAIAVTACAALIRRSPLTEGAAVAWLIPAVLFSGFAYGLFKGGEASLAYNEGRGLLLGVAVFVIASRTLAGNLPQVARTVVISATILAAVVLVRYLWYVRDGTSNVPLEFAFSHEDAVILGIGLLLAAVGLVQIRDRRTAVWLLVCSVVMAAAMVATQRRSATLVLLVGALTMALLMFPRRPVLVACGSIALLLVGAIYLNAYWDKEYGGTAQPARAIRSQFDPSIRDEASNAYRSLETADVTETIRLNRPFGVGFGRPFAQFQPLPDLTSFWPLQNYTPHQNILWLWLKMGVLGIAAFLGLAIVAMRRCLTTMRTATEVDWIAPAVTFTALAMFLVYATVDLGLVGVRSAAPAAVLCAMAFSFRREQAQHP